MLELGLILLCHSVALPVLPIAVPRAAAQEASTEGPLVLRRYNLAGLHAFNSWHEDEARQPLAPLVTEPIGEPGTPMTTYQIEDALEWMSQFIGAEELDTPGRFIGSIDSENVIVSTTAEYHKVIESKLALLRASGAADARIVVERYVVDALPAGFKGGVVTIEAARQQVQSLGTNRRASRHEIRASAFEPTPFGETAHTNMLVDMDVEIANNGRAVDVVHFDAAVGPRGNLRAIPGGGGWHIRIDLGDGGLEPVSRPASIPVRGATATLDTGDLAQFAAKVALRVDHAVSDFFLADGKAAVFVRSAVRKGAQVDVVYAQGGDSAIVRTFGETRSVHLGAALQARTRAVCVGDGMEPYAMGLRNSSRGIEGRFVVIEHLGRGVESVGDLIRFALSSEDDYELDEALGTLQWGASSTGPLHGQYVFESGFAASQPDLVSRLEGLVNALAPARKTLVARGRLLAGDVELARFDVPIGTDGSALVLDTVETPRVVDFDVEVAESASLSDPIVDSIVDGFVANVHVFDRGSDNFDLSVEGVWQTSDVETVETGVILSPLVQSVSIRTIDLSGTANVRLAGDPARFGDLCPGGVRLEIVLTAAN